jgi:hypothetical protein
LNSTGYQWSDNSPLDYENWSGPGLYAQHLKEEEQEAGLREADDLRCVALYQATGAWHLLKCDSLRNWICKIRRGLFRFRFSRLFLSCDNHAACRSRFLCKIHIGLSPLICAACFPVPYRLHGLRTGRRHMDESQFVTVLLCLFAAFSCAVVLKYVSHNWFRITADHTV